MTSSSANNSILHGLRSCLQRGTVDKVITVNRANSPSYAHLHWCFLKCRTWKSEFVLFGLFYVHNDLSLNQLVSLDPVETLCNCWVSPWSFVILLVFVFVLDVDLLAHWWPCAVLCGFPPSVARSCSVRTLAHICVAQTLQLSTSCWWDSYCSQSVAHTNSPRGDFWRAEVAAKTVWSDTHMTPWSDASLTCIVWDITHMYLTISPTPIQVSIADICRNRHNQRGGVLFSFFYCEFTHFLESFYWP